MPDHRALQIVPQPEQTSSPESSPPPQAKYIEACKRKAWALHLWRKAQRPSPQNRKILRYTCRAWRHEGACARWRTSVEYKRMSDALAGVPIEDVLYLVLTFPTRPPGKRARDEAYRSIWRGWQSLRQAIVRGATIHGRRRNGRRWSAQLWGRTSVAYVAIVEQHRRDQWPHLNVILVGHDVARAFARKVGPRGRSGGLAIRWLKTHAKEMGWGHEALWAEPLLEGTKRRIERKELPPDALKNARERLAGYVLKMLGLDIVREVTKLNQAPHAAPHRFRRIRASRGFLAVRHKDPAWTGQLERYPLAELADRLAHWDAVNARHGWSEAPEDDRLTEIFDPAHRPRGPPVTFFASLSPALRVRYWRLRRQLGLSPVPRIYRPPGPPWGPLPDEYA